MITVSFLSSQSADAVHPASAVCGDQHPASCPGPGRDHEDHAALAPRAGGAQAAAPHHGSGERKGGSGGSSRLMPELLRPWQRGSCWPLGLDGGQRACV